MTINVLFGLKPELVQFGQNLLSALEKNMGLFEDLSAKIDDLAAAGATEHEQVMAAIAALQQSASQGLTADQVTALNAKFDLAKSAIAGIYEPTPPTP